MRGRAGWPRSPRALWSRRRPRHHRLINHSRRLFFAKRASVTRADVEAELNAEADKLGLAEDADDSDDDAPETPASESSVAMHAPEGARKEGEEGLSRLAGFAERSLVDEATDADVSREAKNGPETHVEVSAEDVQRSPSQVVQPDLALERAKLESAWAGAKRLGFSPPAVSRQTEPIRSAVEDAAPSDEDDSTKSEAKTLVAEVKNIAENEMPDPAARLVDVRTHSAIESKDEEGEGEEGASMNAAA